jgi:Na+/H+-dicarboxylate symporter
VYPALTTAFFAKSSGATLPVTMDCMIKKQGTDPELARFVLPICTIINMNGCAAFIYTTVLFVSMHAGVHFNAFEMILWIGIATLVAVGNASVPMGCYFLSSVILVGMGVPLTMMGLILPLYTFFDMVETALNVWSDCCVADIVDRQTHHSHHSST